MNGKSFPCGEFAGSLRKYLFKEHLGTLGQENEVFDLDVTDPTSDHFYKEVWYKTASLNTEFYEKVFHCIPTDSVQGFGDLRKNPEEKPLWVNEYSRAQKMLDSIQASKAFSYLCLFYVCLKLWKIIEKRLKNLEVNLSYFLMFRKQTHIFNCGKLPTPYIDCVKMNLVPIFNF